MIEFPDMAAAGVCARLLQPIISLPLKRREDVAMSDGTKRTSKD